MTTQHGLQGSIILQRLHFVKKNVRRGGYLNREIILICETSVVYGRTLRNWVILRGLVSSTILPNPFSQDSLKVKFRRNLNPPILKSTYYRQNQCFALGFQIIFQCLVALKGKQNEKIRNYN